jgi:hypothetical protein
MRYKERLIGEFDGYAHTGMVGVRNTTNHAILTYYRGIKMDLAEQLLTDIVTAIAAATATVCKEIESHQQSQNFRTHNAARSIQAVLQQMPENASNKDTVKDIYTTFIRYLEGKPETAPAIRLRFDRRVPK